MDSDHQNAWRLQFAKDLFARLSVPENLAAAFVGGSVARGLADEYSDLELCFVWRDSPSEEDRKKIVEQFGAKLSLPLERWNHDTHSLEDSLTVSGFQIDVWHGTVANDQADLDAVLAHHDTNLKKLNFIEVISNCVPLYDPDRLLAHWQRRTAEFPEALREKLIAENISFFGSGNANIHLARGDLPILYGLISGQQKRIFNVLLALNYRYFPTYKRMKLHLEEMSLKPPEIERLLDSTYYSAPPGEAWDITERLMRQTLELVAENCPAVDTRLARAQLDRSRQRQAEAP